MKTFALVFGLVLVANLAPAQINYNRALDQARNAANSGGPSANDGGSGQAPSQPSAPPVNPVLAATMQNISSLSADIAALNESATPPDDSLKLPLMNDLAAAPQGTKPSSDSIHKLATDLSNALAGHKNLVDQKTHLAQALHALFNSSHLSSTQQQTLISKVQKMLALGGVSDSDAQTVADDLKAAAAQTK